jgi:uncharacterized heparinase superfamily protein
MLAVVIGPARGHAEPVKLAKASGYARLAAGRTVVIADVGGAIAAEAGSGAHAGCLAFEVSSSGLPLIANAGTRHDLSDPDRAAARATQGHSTLTFANSASSELTARRGADTLVLRSAPLEAGDVPKLVSDADGHVLTARHGGYRRRFGVTHERELRLATDGRRIDGIDRLIPSRAAPAVDVNATQPFDIRFRLHPSVRAELDGSGAVRLIAGNGLRWTFRTETGRIGIEPGRFFAGASRVHDTLQIVVHSTYPDTAAVHWSLVAGL